MSIGSIINGHINELFGLNKDISEVRIRICKKCPLYLRRFGGICNPKLWLNPETNEISKQQIDGYKKGCGCRISAKTTEMKESCPAGKW